MSDPPSFDVANPEIDWKSVASASIQVLADVRAEVERLRSALIEIEKHYGNQDMSHRDFRVMAKQLADEALEQ